MNLSILHAGLLTAGACAVALPILIHILLRRRRTPVAWGAMRFILEAYQQQRKKMRLEQILLLLCRCLLVACLGAAIARPFLPAAPSVAATGPQTVVLFIDNGAASAAIAEGESKSALDAALAQAARLLADLDAARGDRVGVITLAAPAETLVWPPSGDLGAVSRVLGTIQSQASGSDFAGALALAQAVATPAGTKDEEQSQRWVMLSEFRTGSLDIGAPPATTMLPTRVNVTVTGATTNTLANVAVADAALLEPVILLSGASARDEDVSAGSLRVQLQRSGPLAAATSTLRIALGEAGSAASGTATNATVTTTAVNWATGSRQQSVTVATPRGPLSRLRQPVLTVMLDRDGLAMDNTFVLPIVPRDVLTVASVAPAVESPLASLGARRGVEAFSSADWMYLAVEPGGADGGGTGIRRVWIEPGALATSPLSDVDALVLAAPHAVNDAGWKAVATFLDRGGVVLIVPSATAQVQTWSDAVSILTGSPFPMAREPRMWPAGASVVAPDAPANRADPLTLLRAELTPLLNPVNVSRQFVVSPEPTVQPLLTTVERGAAGSVSTSAPLLVALDRVGAARGRIYVFTAAMVPEWTDLPARPLFVPLVQELLRQGLGVSGTPLVQRAGTALMTPPGALTLNSLVTPGQAISVSPRGATLEPVRQRDIFSVIDQRGLNLGVLATSVDPAATNLDVQDGASVKRAVQSMLGLTESPGRITALGESDTAAPAQPNAGVSQQAQRAADEASAHHSNISMWLFVIAAVLAVLDLVMGRWFSHASIKHTKSALDSRVVIERADVAPATPANTTERAA